MPVERYGAPWSDEWSVLELIGHGNRANVLPVEYYERPVPVAQPEYFLPENVAERGRQAARQLGDDPVASVRSASDRALAMASSAPDDAMVGTPFGQRRLADFLPSRTAELVLHGLDLATGIEVPDDALVECGAWLVGTAVRNGYGLEVVRALSGRGTLPPGFNVY